MLAGANLTDLTTTLATNDFLRAQPEDARSGCVSCFHYLLEIRTANGETITIQIDDSGLSGPLRTTINQLAATMLTLLG